ncbi:MAG: hypothetical protein HY557_00935 [Euryarchaeota archaeon]|nr:hypothetical protein [Euryarchaeota archaeon]
MVDMRERVDEDRGLLKRIQLHVPGFAGYRRREDLRTADNLLRIQLANRLKDVRHQLEGARGSLTSNYQLKALEPLGAVILKAQSLEGQIRHAEQGYSPLVADIKVLEPQLNKLYEWDATLLENVDTLSQEASAMDAAAPGEPAEVMDHLNRIKSMLADVEATFKRRMLVITRTEVR